MCCKGNGIIWLPILKPALINLEQRFTIFIGLALAVILHQQAYDV
jgi:hypothetical protein